MTVMITGIIITIMIMIMIIIMIIIISITITIITIQPVRLLRVWILEGLTKANS